MTAPLLTYRANRTALNTVRVALETLYETRLLIQGSSGAGKTQACYQLLQETHGHVQQIVFDREGVYPKLREQFDYLVIGGDGEQRIPMRKGALELQLMKVLELEISAIYDLSDLVPLQQQHVVARLASAMAHLPQRSGLWERMRLVLIDELQSFAPQKGQAESLEPLIELGSLARKRGFCPIGAGTRLAMMNKSVTELLENKLIGRAGTSDAKRAAEELDFDKHGRKELRSLAVGHFYAYGPAIAIDPVLIRTPETLTVMPRRRGEHQAPTPATSAKVKRALVKFAGLEEEAEEKERTLEQLQAELAAERAKRRQLEKGAPAPVIDDRAIERAVAKERHAGEEAYALLAKTTTRLMRDVEQIAGVLTGASEGLRAAVQRTDVAKAVTTVDSRAEVQVGNQEQRTGANHPTVSAVGRSSRAPARPVATFSPSREPGSGKQRILDAIAELYVMGIHQPTRMQVGIIADYDLTGGVGSKHVSAMKEEGLLTIPAAGALALTDAGARIANYPATPTTREGLHRQALGRLSEGERRILEHLLELYPEATSRAEVGAAVRYDLTGGVGSKHVAKLVKFGFATIPSAGKLQAGALLFPPGLR